MAASTALPELISEAQTSEEQFLRQIFVRDQMAEWSKQPLIMARADGVHYWDINGKRYLDALSGIYVVALGHNTVRGAAGGSVLNAELLAANGVFDTA